MSAIRSTGKSDTGAILDALRLILEPGQVTELRSLDAVTAADRRPHVEAGYFNDPEKLTRAAASIVHAKGIYFVPNPVNPALLGRAVNKLRPAPKGESTQDADILCRRWLLIDTDPVRPSGIASTDAEHQGALARAENIAQALAAEGWPPSIVADSGNGGHLLYRIDLPTADDGLVQRCLQSLAAQFDDALVKVDQSVFNPARIWKLYGTIAAKGDAEAEAIGRPHRMARILTAPDALTCVSGELLEALATRAPAPATKKASTAGPKREASATTGSAFDLERWIREHGLAVTGPEDWRDKSGETGKRWVFEVCPWNSDHTNGSAFILQFVNGAIAAGCHHNSCSGNDWAALRGKFEPAYHQRRQVISQTGATAPPLDVSQIQGQLAAALAAGPEALYRDGELLRALANLAESDPAEFACCRAQMQRTSVKLRDFDRALAPLRQELRRQRPALDAAGCYRVAAGRIVRDQLTREGPVETALANFEARIVEQVTVDDGAERRLTFVVEGALADGTPLPRAEVAAEKFAWMRWPVETWGTRAVVLAGAGTADHLRAALQLLSGEVPRRTVYAHTGWRELNGCWLYLHAGGAIGPAGHIKGVEVILPDALSRFQLPAPPEGPDLIRAIRASLAMLDLAPQRITAPLLGAVYRAALDTADYSLHLAGPTGTGKSELSALCQQHYGAELDARHLPGNWASTGNSLMALAFVAKDMLMVCDDFAPGGTTADVARYHKEADRLLRAQGNRAGRGRCRADGSLTTAKPPRGTILSTGEDVPRGQSLRARLLVLELAPRELDWSRLSAAQYDAAAGLYAQALAGYLRWLAPQYPTIRDGLRAETAVIRERVHAAGSHARTPGIIADLAAGWRWWLDYALAAGVIDQAERGALAQRVWQALLEVAACQAEHVQAADPIASYLRLLAAALASGRAHVAGPDGGEPDSPEAWGWREVTIGAGQHQRTEWQAQGRRIGWLDAAGLYLEPEAAYAEGQRLAGEQGEALPVGARTLWRRMRERGLLATWDAGRQRSTVRRTLEGVHSRDVIHLRPDALSTCSRPSTSSTTATPSHQDRGGVVDGYVDGLATERPDRPRNGVARTAPEDVLDGLDGHVQVDMSPSANGLPRHDRRRGTL
jgi:hypothetical protein